MKTFKTFAFLMVAAWVAVSATAKTGVDDRSMNEVGYQKAATAPDRSVEGKTASYAAAKKAKVQSPQTVTKAKASIVKSTKKAPAKKKATAKKAVVKTPAKKAVVKAPAKKAVVKAPAKKVEQAR